MSPNASHRVRPGLSSAASLMTTLQISFDQEVLNQHLNLVTPEYPFFESPWERTSYSSSPTSPLAASKQASIVQRVPATWTRVASDLDKGGKFCALRRERQIIAQLIQLLERAPDQERFLPAFTRAPERDTRPVVQARPLGPVAGAQPRPAPLGHL